MNYLPRIVSAYCVAVCVAGLLLTVYQGFASAGDFRFTFLFADDEEQKLIALEASPFTYFMSITTMTTLFTILPAFVLIYFAECKTWRSVVFYLGVGAVLGLPVGLWFEALIMAECASIGAVAGLTYWALAGRFAGLREKAQA